MAVAAFEPGSSAVDPSPHTHRWVHLLPDPSPVGGCGWYVLTCRRIVHKSVYFVVCFFGVVVFKLKNLTTTTEKPAAAKIPWRSRVSKQNEFGGCVFWSHIAPVSLTVSSGHHHNQVFDWTSVLIDSTCIGLGLDAYLKLTCK